jgi:hypothetical protein
MNHHKDGPKTLETSLFNIINKVELGRNWKVEVIKVAVADGNRRLKF